MRQGNPSFVLTAVATILRDLGLVSLILFFLRRNGENGERIGWSLRRAGREAALGVAHQWLEQRRPGSESDHPGHEDVIAED